ncbi:MAG TPA: ROK family protein [Acidimicrobiales bacterium]|nr:ROK family protein [Acidimicrobiales bacterium]
MAGEQTIGVDLGGTKCLGVVLDARGQVTAEHRVPTPHGADAIVEAIAEVAARLGPGLPVGVGAPGLVDRDGLLRFAPNLPGVFDLPLRDLLVERLGVDVEIENDATAACWAERQFGAAQGATDAVVVTLGTGIGGGIVADNQLLRGANGFAGEIGHMVVDPHGPPCPCGKRGCWERFASGSGLGRMARDAAMAGRAARVLDLADGDAEAVRGEHVTQACEEGDAEAKEIMAQFAWWLALGLVNLAYLLDPEVFVLGGGLVASGGVLLDPARVAFAELLAGVTHRPVVRIEVAALGERAGAIGAALLARGR